MIHIIKKWPFYHPDEVYGRISYSATEKIAVLVSVLTNTCTVAISFPFQVYITMGEWADCAITIPYIHNNIVTIITWAYVRTIVMIIVYTILILKLGLCNIIGIPVYCNIFVSNTYCDTFFQKPVRVQYNVFSALVFFFRSLFYWMKSRLCSTCLSKFTLLKVKTWLVHWK